MRKKRLVSKRTFGKQPTHSLGMSVITNPQLKVFKLFSFKGIAQQAPTTMLIIGKQNNRPKIKIKDEFQMKTLSKLYFDLILSLLFKATSCLNINRASQRAQKWQISVTLRWPHNGYETNKSVLHKYSSNALKIP